MNSRHELTNAVIQAIGAKSFLQIGSARHVEEIACPVKQSYYLEDADQIPAGRLYDVVFVDPPHDASRALFALNVAMERLSPKGVLLVANVNPAEEWMQEVPASAGVALGQAWRAWVEFRGSVRRYTYTADLDHGVGVVAPSPAPVFDHRPVDDRGALGFETFAGNRSLLLNLTSPAEVLRALRADTQRDTVIEVLTGRSMAPVPTFTATDVTPEPTPADPVTATALPTTDQPESEPTPRRRRRDRSPA